MVRNGTGVVLFYYFYGFLLELDLYSGPVDGLVKFIFELRIKSGKLLLALYR